MPPPSGAGNGVPLTQTDSELEKVIIFGASGFIGKNLRSHLQKKSGLEIVGYSSSECDLLNPTQAAEALKNCNGGTSIVLCSSIPRRKEESWATMLKNIEMVHNLCAGIPDAGIR
ncbi:MAG TPA: NAD-dependent epimerase/dehydratase family protein, partial [Phycisphaerales bacterium]|nr:NAD-dependent epimerase/dehydratase family protein [Phycisphaerales bacterium]